MAASAYGVDEKYVSLDEVSDGGKISEDDIDSVVETKSIMINPFKVFITPSKVKDFERRAAMMDSISTAIEKNIVAFMNPPGEKKPEYKSYTEYDTDEADYNDTVVDVFIKAYNTLSDEVDMFMVDREETYFNHVDTSHYTEQLVKAFDTFRDTMSAFGQNNVFVDMPKESYRFFYKMSIGIAKTPKWAYETLFPTVTVDDLPLYVFIITTRISTKSRSVIPGDWFQWFMNDFRILPKWRSTRGGGETRDHVQSYGRHKTHGHPKSRGHGGRGGRGGSAVGGSVEITVSMTPEKYKQFQEFKKSTVTKTVSTTPEEYAAFILAQQQTK